jgi:dienelactone hydrolase
MAHGTTGTRDFALPSYSARFAAAGLAVLAFDYRHFGASEGEPRQLIDVQAQLADLRTAISHVRALPEVDAARVALWGTSLGAGHVLSIAAEDAALAAGVAQLPFLGVDPRHKSPRSTAVTLKLFARAVRDAAGSRFGRPAVMMPMLGQPGEVAVFTGADDYESMRALETAAPEWRNAMAGRSLFSLLRYKPVKLAARVSVPLLILAAEGDTAASMRLTEQAAENAPRAELRRYPGSHFSAYRGEVLEQMAADEIAFLSEHLQQRSPVLT